MHVCVLYSSLQNPPEQGYPGDASLDGISFYLLYITKVKNKTRDAELLHV